MESKNHNYYKEVKDYTIPSYDELYRAFCNLSGQEDFFDDIEPNDIKDFEIPLVLSSALMIGPKINLNVTGNYQDGLLLFPYGKKLSSVITLIRRDIFFIEHKMESFNNRDKDYSIFLGKLSLTSCFLEFNYSPSSAQSELNYKKIDDQLSIGLVNSIISNSQDKLT